MHLRKIGALVAASASTLAAISGGHAAALSKTGASPAAPQAVLVTFRHRVDAAALAGASRYAGPLRVRRTYEHLPVVAATLSADQVSALGADPDVVRVAPDGVVRLPPTAAQPGVVPPSYYAPVAVRQADRGIGAAQTKLGLDGDAAGDGVRKFSKNDEVIAIVDSGVDGTQPDLAGGKILTFHDFVSAPAPQCAPPPDPIVAWDSIGHGTLVASVAAGAGVAQPAMTGVAPGAALVVLKVFDCTGSAPQSDVAAALDWLLSHHKTYGVDVVNMSFGSVGQGLDGTDLMSQLTNQLAAAGVVPVVAAGNNGPTLGSVNSPGVARWALTAGAEKANPAGNDLAEFSSRGPTADGRVKPDVLTPGVDILGVVANVTVPAYAWNSGTSFSAPYLSGLAALALQANPALKPSGTACDPATCADGVVDANMRAPLTRVAHSSAADWNVAGPDSETGWGVLHAWPFLAAAAQSIDPGPTYPKHLVRRGSVPAGGETFIPIRIRAGQTVTVGVNVPTVNGFNGPFFGLFAVDDRGAPIEVGYDCASAGRVGGGISGICYPYGSASRAVGMAWTPSADATAFIGIRSLAGATTAVVDIDGAREAANAGMPVRVSVSGTPLAPGGTRGAVLVRLGRKPAQTVHVRLSNDGGLSLSRTLLTFSPANWYREQTVRVAALAQSTRWGDPHGSTLVATATGRTIDDSGISKSVSVPVLDASSLPDGPHTERVSLTDAGGESWGGAYDASSPYPFGNAVPIVSSDGSVVAFASRASDLTSSDPNQLRSDVFVRDRSTGHTEKITPDTEMNDSYLQGMSADGRYVLFSAYDGVISGDDNNASDLFVKDRTTGSVSRVNLTSAGAPMPERCSGCSGLPGAISSDGHTVSFITDVPMTPDAPATGTEVYVRDLSTGVVTRVSVASDGANGLPTDGTTWEMMTALSGDGSIVLFSTASDGLAPHALTGEMNVYEHVMATGRTTLVNSDAAGTALRLQVGTPALLSERGAYAAFESAGPPYYYSKIYVKNLTTGAIELVNVTPSGDPSLYGAELTSISADGRTVAFWTDDPAIGGGGMVMRNLDTGVVTSIAARNPGLFETRGFARISADAKFAVWASSDANLVPGDTNRATDTFWRRLF